MITISIIPEIWLTYFRLFKYNLNRRDLACVNTKELIMLVSYYWYNKFPKT